MLDGFAWDVTLTIASTVVSAVTLDAALNSDDSSDDPDLEQ